MHHKDLLELADDPLLIPGIYNYCDRWCERCSFTSRCLLYKTEKADESPDPATHDITNAAFWNKLRTIFAETKEMITAWAEENGVDLSPAALAEVGEQQAERRHQVKQHALAKSAESYAFAVEEWFKRDLGEQRVFTDSAHPSVESDVIDVDDCVEVIRWYQFLIAVKLMRGLTSRFEDGDDIDEAYPRDSDGSVKVALVGIQRSMTAWRHLSEALPEKADSVCELLMTLERLRLQVEREFPMANDFIRPGLDENILETVQ